MSQLSTADLARQISQAARKYIDEKVDQIQVQAGTAIKQNGVLLNEWNPDTKLDAGKAITYKPEEGLRIYKTDKNTGEVSKSEYAALRFDSVIDVRSPSSSAQYGSSSLTINNLTNGSSTRYNAGQILTKASSSASWKALNIPSNGGTLAITGDISDAIKNFVTNQLPSEINKAVKSKAEWIQGSGNRTLTVDVGAKKGYIILYRSNDKNQDIQLTYNKPDGGTGTASAQMMIVFIPKETYATNRKRIWVITIDQGTIMPSVDASTYDALTSSLTFAPTASAAVDRLVMEY